MKYNIPIFTVNVVEYNSYNIQDKNAMKKKKYYTDRTVQKYHTDRTVQKYHTDRTVPKMWYKLISLCMIFHLTILN